MESRSHRYEISRPQPIPPPPPPVPPPPPSSALPEDQLVEPALWTSILPRPLSDIRELSEPSLMDNVIRYPHRHQRSISRASSMRRRESQKHAHHATNHPQIILQPQHDGSSSYSSTPEAASFYSIPQSSVPRRSSSFHCQPRSHARKPSIRTQPSSSLAPPTQFSLSIPNRGGSQSPVKEARLRLDPISSDVARRVPSRTNVRSPHSTDILDFPTYKHPRLKLELQISAPLFIGGGTVEGYVKVIVDDGGPTKNRRSIAIGAVSVDLLGFEQMDGNRKATFLALGTELIDANHPPPAKMVQPVHPLFADDKFWTLTSSWSALPFMISLPLDTGPPPFQSKHANIRFLLSATALVRDTGKHYRVRCSQDVHVLPTYDPEKALTSLPSPLTASDELQLPRSTGHESLRVTAGLHRQVWVSGSSIFVDVHIVNRGRKPVRKMELTLERDILCYKHAAAATLERSASQARIFESKKRTILAKTCFKHGSTGWNGVEPHMSDIRTCELELPRGHGTVRCGKYFEVRYFLNVTASLANSKLVSVQLPIILIHMNSLDVMPNSVAQVAAAIEEKRTCRRLSQSRTRQDGENSRQRSFSSPARTTDLKRQPSYAQGRAFAAPLQQSVDRQRQHKADIEELRNIIDSSPRRHGAPSVKGFSLKKVTSETSLGTLAFAGRSTETLGVLRAMSYQTPPSTTRGTVKPEREETGGLRGRMRRIGSLDSVHNKATTKRRSKEASSENKKPRIPSSASQTQIAPHTLGLTTTTRKVSIDAQSERSGTAMSLREKLDRSRFEFKAVRRKASGGLKERSMNWWDSRKNRDKDRVRDGWI